MKNLKVKKRYAVQSGLCFYCDVELTEEDSTVDHFYPLVALRRLGEPGGYLFALKRNGVFSCYACNQDKGERFPSEAEVSKYKELYRHAPKYAYLSTFGDDIHEDKP